jgi:ABC-type multidrug transport system fused ATPase/permease subunit
MSLARTTKAGNIKRAYSKCAGYSEEVLCAIRTVYAFCAEQFEKSKYVKELLNAQNAAINNAKAFGAAIGLLNFSVILTEGLGFFIGSYFIQYDVYNSESGENYSCASIITVFFAGMFAMVSLGLLAPALQAVEDAKEAAFDIMKLLAHPAKTKLNLW